MITLLPALLLLSCVLAGGGTDGAPPATTTTIPLPEGYRSCLVDADCVVAPALAGLDHLPTPGESCVAECVVGVRRDAEAAWTEAVRRETAGVPCDKEMEPCPPISAWVAFCHQQTCGARYAPSPTP